MPNALLESTEISDQIDDQLLNSGYDPDNDPYVGALIDPVKESLEDLNDQMRNTYNRSILELATDTDLDEKITEFGVARGDIGIPFDDTETNFYVAIQTGVASQYSIDILSPLVIPPEAISILDVDGNQYNINESVIINPSEFSAFIPISANAAIPGGVAVDSIINCTVDVTQVQNLNPTQYENISFICSNNKALSTPDAASTDEDLRDSAFLRINAMNNTNENAITLALNNYGIYDISYKRNMFGFGTLGVIAKIGNSPQISTTTLQIINNILANICPFARVVEPEMMVLKFSARTTFIDETIIDETKAEILVILQDYFNLLDLGTPIIPETIKENILAINNVDTFDIVCMFIDDRPCIKTRQEAMSDQMFVLNESDPIIYVS